jgi:hypothetical protein
MNLAMGLTTDRPLLHELLRRQIAVTTGTAKMTKTKLNFCVTSKDF